MRYLPAIILSIVLAGPAGAQEIASAYTELDLDRDCKQVEQGEIGGSGALACRGYRDYPVYVFTDDARDSLYYGFLPPNGRPAWDSFQGFNEPGPKVEWRIERLGGRELPFATIHRRFVSGDSGRTEVLVVSKVGQRNGARGCIVGYVVATGNPGANEQARQVADREARGFACGADQPVALAGRVPLPPLSGGR